MEEGMTHSLDDQRWFRLRKERRELVGNTIVGVLSATRTDRKRRKEGA